MTHCTRHNLPLYQYIVPKSCGPCCSLHVRVISLPDLTYKSDGPCRRAFSSTRPSFFRKGKISTSWEKKIFQQEKNRALNEFSSSVALNAFLMKIKHDTFAVRSIPRFSLALCASSHSSPFLRIYVFGKNIEEFLLLFQSRCAKCKV